MNVSKEPIIKMLIINVEKVGKYSQSKKKVTILWKHKILWILGV